TRESKDKKKGGKSSHSSSHHYKEEDKAANMAKLRADRQAREYCKANISKLRADRQAREASERARVQQIMGGGPATAPAPRRSEVSEDYREGYNSVSRAYKSI
ncbi:hypothetical protein T484DRAFT_1857974, partial [Baffinella frigidus]